MVEQYWYEFWGQDLGTEVLIFIFIILGVGTGFAFRWLNAKTPSI